ncbi:MAG: 5-methyltetrahydropteroyltriglutamate--homocysteine S-methyltransferase [Acidobacteriota bacterium]|nr:MAG: 5-methyltetrahydropteroyltriglutamate--homocysteine S-methyltransferase [Acidobacteriota bacterium]
MTFVFNLGFPRIGRRRELKKATEGYWKGAVSEKGLREAAREIRRANWIFQKDAGLDSIPCNDFSFYDHVLDAVALLGAVPPRYGWKGGTVDLDTYFAMARGAQREGLDVTAMEMTKWFDTNYHYIVPEFYQNQEFRLSSEKPFEEFEEAKAVVGGRARPVLVGPLSFVLLGKAKDEGVSPLRDVLPKVLDVYKEALGRLSAAGAEWVQFDEPCLVQDRSSEELEALKRTYQALAEAKGGVKILVATYFGHVGDAYDALAVLPVDGVAFDLVRGRRNLDFLREKGFPREKTFVAGVVDGRNVWLNDLEASLGLLQDARKHGVAGERLAVAPSCSLLHVPVDADQESALDAELRSWLAFAKQKVREAVALARALDGRRDEAFFDANRKALESRRTSKRTRNPQVRERVEKILASSPGRSTPAGERFKIQRERLPLPSFPTTTIGSFPQTQEVRKARLRFRKKEMSETDYKAFLKEKTRDVVELQEEIGLDVLVHGEFERNDMVEYFGELLDGFAFTQYGWVQSYGSRCVKPPVIFGDVARPRPMTTEWIGYAQSLTKKPLKGMLTGPVTILTWSFVRDDQPRSETCAQIAVALRDEVLDLESEGIRIVQIDEPTLREGMPLRKEERPEYLDWAVRSFLISSSGVRDETQIHTHMCYCEFGDIMESISALDADVLYIENSRSDQELLDVFKKFRYDKGVGPGVYDIHSPRVPGVEEMEENLRASAKVLDPGHLWVNPDCGLKTRGFEETTPTLKNMVAAAKRMRA